MSCYRLAGFGVCACFAPASPLWLCGIFSGMKGKSVLGDMAFPSYGGCVSCCSCLQLFSSAQIMAFFLLDANGKRIAGPYDTQQLHKLAMQGYITQNMLLESETGYRGTAAQIPGVFAVTVTTAPTAAAKTVVLYMFCTNCGNAVPDHATGCISCGLKPTGHTNFCRQCGAGRKPEQVLCTQCGANFDTTSLADAKKVKGSAAPLTPAKSKPLSVSVPPVYRPMSVAPKSNRPLGKTFVSMPFATIRLFYRMFVLIMALILVTSACILLYNIVVLTDAVPPPPAGHWLEKTIFLDRVFTPK